MPFPRASQALSRFTVLDLTRIRSGPTCVRQLADWGANVVKIDALIEDAGSEQPGGPRQGSDFQNLHRNKRAMTLNLKDERGLAVFKRLAQQADVVVASSAWLQNTVQENYGKPHRAEVIHNGRNPIHFNPYLSKQTSVLAAGRTLDLSKGIDLLTRYTHDLLIQIAGSEMPPAQAHSPIRTDLRLAVDEAQVSFKGAQTEAQMRMLLSRSSIYAATSRYDASGAGTLEAAFSRCAIVANDIPVHRELWGEAALYFETNRSQSLAECIRALRDDTQMCREYGNRAYQRARERFTARRMANDYLTLYRRLAYDHRAVA